MQTNVFFCFFTFVLFDAVCPVQAFEEVRCEG